MDIPLANTVSAYAIILSGSTVLLFCWFVAPQPRRWVAVYAAVFITSLPTVWFHGFGETFWAGVFDGGTNLLLAWLLQIAALWDEGAYKPRTRTIIASVTGIANLLAIAAKVSQGPASSRIFPVRFGDFGGFTLNELVLIANSILAVGFLYGRHKSLSVRSRPLLYLSTFFFLVGSALATASNQQVDFIILAYHATWHIVGAFGFLFLWAFNHVRFEQVRPVDSTSGV